MAQDYGKTWRQNGNDWGLENADLWMLPCNLGKYKEEQDTLASFRNVPCYDNFHIHHEKLIVLLEKKKYLKSTT